MTKDPNQIVANAISAAISQRGELGIQVAAYLDGKQVVDTWGGIADETTRRKVDGETLFPAFMTKAVTAVALHIQAERGLVDYEAPIARYWPEFGANDKGKGTIYDALTHRLGVPLMPSRVTPELMCNWEWMVHQIANMSCLFEPGTKSAYQSYTFGWIVGEVVRRTDPKRRPFGKFVQEEICQPLGIDNLFLGIPDEVEPRIARLKEGPWPQPAGVEIPPDVGPPDSLHALAVPPQVRTSQEVFGRPDVRRACIPPVGGILNARSLARFYAMLANSGSLGDVRLFSEERVHLFSAPRPPCDRDLVLGVPHRGSIGGFHLAGGKLGMEPAGKNWWIFGHPAAGGSVGWADTKYRLSVAILHNRMVSANVPDNPLVPIGKAVREALGVPG